MGSLKVTRSTQLYLLYVDKILTHEPFLQLTGFYIILEDML